MMKDSIDPIFPSIVETIHLGKNFIALPHINIDGDDLGSMLALYWGFKKINKNVALFTTDSIPFVYTFLPGVEKIRNFIPDRKFDAALMLECSTPARLPAKINLKQIAHKVINLDHHPDNSAYGDLNYIDSKAAALGEIVYFLLKTLDVEMDYNIAVNLYTAILTDCGSFQYSNTTSNTHKIVSELLKFPIDVNQISKKIYRETDFNTLKLLGEVLSTLDKTNDGKVVWAEVTPEMMKKYNAFEENTQHFIDSVNHTAGHEIAILFKETPENTTKASVRSDIYPVNELSAEFGGGGHKQAAGCTINASLPEAKKLFLEKINEMFYNK
ncbi:MAG: bifunctional oligoribonuclease/PAP phosphatase NrnA [Armatimonadota bacterium]